MKTTFEAINVPLIVKYDAMTTYTTDDTVIGEEHNYTYNELKELPAEDWITIKSVCVAGSDVNIADILDIDIYLEMVEQVKKEELNKIPD